LVLPILSSARQPAHPPSATPAAYPTCPVPCGLQEFKLLEDAAFKVLEAVEGIKAELAAKEVQLGAIRTEFEQKKKEVGGWVGWGWASGDATGLEERGGQDGGCGEAGQAPVGQGAEAMQVFMCC
jgi:hypothetical protein